jgi:hypothetical protein
MPKATRFPNLSEPDASQKLSESRQKTTPMLILLDATSIMNQNEPDGSPKPSESRQKTTPMLIRLDPSPKPSESQHKTTPMLIRHDASQNPSETPQRTTPMLIRLDASPKPSESRQKTMLILLDAPPIMNQNEPKGERTRGREEDRTVVPPRTRSGRGFVGCCASSLHFEMRNPQINHGFEASFLFLSFFKTWKPEITPPYWSIASSGRKRMLIRAIHIIANALVHGHAPLEPDEIEATIGSVGVQSSMRLSDPSPICRNGIWQSFLSAEIKERVFECAYF